MNLQTFSFRAECLVDVQAFNKLLSSRGFISELKTEADDAGLPDVEVEMKAGATLGQLRELLRHVVDGHVILQTLRPVPLSENSLERDYDLR